MINGKVKLFSNKCFKIGNNKLCFYNLFFSPRVCVFLFIVSVMIQPGCTRLLLCCFQNSISYQSLAFNDIDVKRKTQIIIIHMMEKMNAQII